MSNVADSPKSLWQIVWSFCGHFSTAIWVTSVVIGIILWLLSLPPVLKGGIGSLLIALSITSIVNRVVTNRQPAFVTLGKLGGASKQLQRKKRQSVSSINEAKRTYVIDTLKALIKEGTEIATWGDAGGFITVIPENQEKFKRIDAYKPRVLRFLEQYGDQSSVELFQSEGVSALELFLKQILEDENAASISTTATPRDTDPNVEIGTLECSTYCDETHQVRGALIIAENEFTGRKYRATTNRNGGARLSVPYGNYSVSIEAENYLPRTEAVKVGDGLAHISFRMEMVKAAREQHINEVVSITIKGLSELSETGGELLKQAASNPTNDVREKVAAWESEVLLFLNARLSKAEGVLFSSNAPVEVYPIQLATAAHRHLLDHINTRVIRLNNIIRRLQDQLDKGMLY